MSHKSKRRPGAGEIWLAVTKHDGVQVDSILIDQAKFGDASRQARASNFDLPVALGLQLADRALKIILNKPGIGADRLQRARDDPFRLVPPRRREGAFRCIPFRLIVVPVPHDLIHSATVDTARLPLRLLDEVAEERGAWRKRHMIDVAVQGLVHSEHELSHTHFLSLHGTSAPKHPSLWCPCWPTWAVEACVTHPRRKSPPHARKSLRTEARSCGPSSWRNCDPSTWRRRCPGGRSSPGCSRPTKPPLRSRWSERRDRHLCRLSCPTETSQTASLSRSSRRSTASRSRIRSGAVVPGRPRTSRTASPWPRPPSFTSPFDRTGIRRALSLWPVLRSTIAFGRPRPRALLRRVVRDG